LQSPFIRNKESGKKREKIRLNRRVATFVVCVGISILFWFMMELSKEYTIALSYPVSYINGPKDKVVSNNLPSIITIEIHSKGFFLMAYKFKKAQLVSIDLNDIHPMQTKNNFYLLTNSRLNKITEQFSSEVQVLRIVPDTIFLNFNKKITKEVPVKAMISLELASQFQLEDSIRIEPAEIEIAGAADAISQIDHVETVPATIKSVNGSKTIQLNLAKLHQAGVEMSVASVHAVINVKKYTEGNLELPVEAINLPAGYSLKSFPDKVQVRYNVTFEDYDKINASMFRAVIDYKKMEQGSNKLKVQLEKVPEEVRSVRLNPEKVEFIIRK
jgi:YbbR domain-containing protein